MQKNERFILNKEILPKGKRGGVDWFNVKEIEVYFTDTEKNYTLKVDDVTKDKNKTIKILLSYVSKSYKRYFQPVQILNGNMEDLFNYFNIKGNKLRPFRLSDDGTYWIGTTCNNIEFYFNGQYSEEIMKHNWRLSNGYIITSKKRKNIRLNRMVLGVTDRNIVVNHYGGNKMDNRVEKLSLSDHEDNAKELLPSVRNNTGITGLTKIKYNKYRIQCTVNGFSYTSTYNTKDEALIDLLIIQRNYEYRHNEKLYYLINSISQEYIEKLIEKVEDKIKSCNVKPIICKNRFELSEDGSFYYMYDKRDNRCKISIEDLELVKQGNWRLYVNTGEKEYFHGEVIYNGKRKGIFLHRFLMDLTNPNYRHWYIDHLDGDGLNNTRDNIIITDAQGNGLNKQRTYNYQIENGKYKYMVKTLKKVYSKSFVTEDEGKVWIDNICDELLRNRIQFKSREELDNYISKNKI